MTKSEAATIVAGHYGLSRGSVEIESVTEDFTEIGGVLYRRIRIVYRFTERGEQHIRHYQESIIAPEWKPSLMFTTSFRIRFWQTPNSRRVNSQMTGDHYSQRAGAYHVAAIAKRLGPSCIAAFEAPHALASGHTQFIDIAMKDRIAVEAKSLTVERPLTHSILTVHMKQAKRRLLPTVTRDVYRGVLLVYSSGALANCRKELGSLHRSNPRIRISEIDGLEQALEELKRSIARLGK